MKQLCLFVSYNFFFIIVIYLFIYLFFPVSLIKFISLFFCSASGIAMKEENKDEQCKKNKKILMAVQQ